MNYFVFASMMMVTLASVHAYGYGKIDVVNKNQYLEMIESKDNGETVYRLKNPTNADVEFWSKTIDKSGRQQYFDEDLSLKMNVVSGDYSKADFYTTETVQVPHNTLLNLQTTHTIQAKNIDDTDKQRLVYVDDNGDETAISMGDVESYDTKSDTIEAYDQQEVFSHYTNYTQYVLFDPAIHKVPANGVRDLKVKVTPKMGTLPDGTWGYSLDQVICTGGVCYTEYSWYNASFGFKYNLTVNTTGYTTAALIDFPVQVVLTTTNFNYSRAQTAGQDIRFVDSTDSTLLDYEIDVWNTTGNSYIWVRVPTVVAGGLTNFSMYYNCTACADAQDSAGVWRNNYSAVYHFTQNPNATGPGQLYDSIKLSNGTTNGSFATTQLINNVSGRAWTFIVASSQHVIVNNSAGRLSITGTQVNLEFYGTVDSLAATRGWISKGTAYALRHQGGGATTASRVTVNGSTSDGLATVFANNYSTIAGDYDGSNKRIYSNGTVRVTAALTTTIPSNTNDICIGYNSCTGLGMSGSIDEMRVSNVTRTASWINMSYITIIGNGTLFVANETAPVTTSLFDSIFFWGGV